MILYWQTSKLLHAGQI